MRWQATVIYRTDEGRSSVLRDMGELSELHGIIEGGPHWDTIVKIEIVRINGTSKTLTVEEAGKLR
jgi:hypothetical protein